MEPEKVDLVFGENNDPSQRFKLQREDENGVLTPEPLSGGVVEFYLKLSKTHADTDPTTQKRTSAVSTEIEILDAAQGLVKVHLLDVDLEDRWYHLDFLKDGKRLTFAYGKIKVIDV